MTTEKMRVSASSVISNAAAMAATPTRDRRNINATVYFTQPAAMLGVNYATVRNGAVGSAKTPRSAGGARLGAARENEPGGLVLLCLAAWAIPGAGHLWLGRRTKGLIFLVAVPLMFAIGLAINGRLFPFEASDPLVFLAALADMANGLPYLL